MLSLLKFNLKTRSFTLNPRGSLPCVFRTDKLRVYRNDGIPGTFQSLPPTTAIRTYLNAEARGLPLLCDCTLPASSTEHIGADLGFALRFFLKHRS